MKRRNRSFKGREKLGGYFYQLSVYSYAGMLIAVLLDYEKYGGHALYLGMSTTVCFAFLGWMLNDMSNK